MKKDIKDYLHLYLGCECIVESFVKQHGSIGYVAESCFGFMNGRGREIKTSFDKVKPILRPLSDITEEEAVELSKPVVIYGDLPNVRKYEVYENTFGKKVVSWGNGMREKYVPQDETAFVPQQIIYLLKQGFDLFGLIEAGLAIDKTKTK